MTKQIRITNEKRQKVAGDWRPVAGDPSVTNRPATGRKETAFVTRHLLVCFLVLLGAQARGQEKVHFLSSGKLPPGAVGAQQLMRGGPLAGYFQPIEIKAPPEALVSVAIDGQFAAPQRTPLKIAMLVAPVYRLRVTEIPNRIGEEVYPTVEIINRIYPPIGEEFRFPIPIELTQQDLELALDGKFVTRIVYLEDPQQALPVAKDVAAEQSFFEVRPSDDPLEIADRLGRPVAIIRLGGRLPDPTGPDEKFLFGSPPLLIPNSLDVFAQPHVEAQDNSDPPPRLSDFMNQSSARVALVPAMRKPLAPRGDSEPSDLDPQAKSGAFVTRSQAPLANPGAPGRSSASPVVKAVVQRVVHHAWQPDKPAPAAVSVSDAE